MFFRDSPLALEQSDCEISLASIDTFISNIPKKKQTANTVHNFCDVLLSYWIYRISLWQPIFSSFDKRALHV